MLMILFTRYSANKNLEEIMLQFLKINVIELTSK